MAKKTLNNSQLDEITAQYSAKLKKLRSRQVAIIKKYEEEKARQLLAKISNKSDK